MATDCLPGEALNSARTQSIVSSRKFYNHILFFAVCSTKHYRDTSEMCPRTLKNKSVSDLANSISIFAEKGERMADITLLCGEKRFPVHKAILAARSDVFATMFNHNDTEEANTNEVQIVDTDPSTLERLLW